MCVHAWDCWCDRQPDCFPAVSEWSQSHSINQHPRFHLMAPRTTYPAAHTRLSNTTAEQCFQDSSIILHTKYRIPKNSFCVAIRVWTTDRKTHVFPLGEIDRLLISGWARPFGVTDTSLSRWWYWATAGFYWLPWTMTSSA